MLSKKIERVWMNELHHLDAEYHPLAHHSHYHWKGIDKRFGVHRYKCVNSTLNVSLCGEELGTTGVRFSLSTIEGRYIDKPPCIIAWVRRHGTERIKEAIACAIMLGHETIVIAHAFEEP